MPDLDADAIAGAATGPSEAAADGQSAKIVPIPDQIAADKYRRANASAASSTWAGLGKHRGIPPGPQQ